MARRKYNWTEKAIAHICDEISGGASVGEVCAQKGMPSKALLYRHMAANEEFAIRIATARAAQQDHEADACIDMADAATPENYQVVKLRIWARQWRAAKLAPKRYGDRIDVGNADGKPFETNDTSVSEKLASILALAAHRKQQSDGSNEPG